MTTQPASPKVTLRLVIHGRVQGVFFRDSMFREAQQLAVSGWVRNRSDGTVEAVVQGTSADVDAIVRWAKRGPERARVEQVEIEPAAGTSPALKSFMPFRNKTAAIFACERISRSTTGSNLR